MYKVVREFYDLQDAISTKGGTIYHHYAEGDLYPRDGLDPSAGRIEELLGCSNAQGIPLIEPVQGSVAKVPEPTAEPEAPAAENEKPEPEAKKPKRRAAKK